METLPRFGISRADMMKRVARFDELKGSDGGLPDGKAPQCERTLYNVIGFQPPKDAGGAVTSPVGDDASRLSAIPISEGFNLGYCRAKPGKGPMMHNHDTNETFIPMTGTWRCSWENDEGEVESVDLNPLDVISFPPGAIRRFENIAPGASGEDGILMFVIGGDCPKAEFTDTAMKELDQGRKTTFATLSADPGSSDSFCPLDRANFGSVPITEVERQTLRVTARAPRWGRLV
jgi:mannose-6-phosphate isomerase-like protein (cupin superfamily)